MDSSQFQNTLLLALVQIGIIAGLAGLLIPVFPGLLVVWVSILVYGLLAGFNWWGILLFLLISIIGLGASLADNVLMAGGARSGGASWSSVIVALIAGVVGTIIMPPFGGLLFAPLAILGLEYYRRRDWKQAREALVGMVKGWGVAFFVRLMGGILMMIMWWIWVAINQAA